MVTAGWNSFSFWINLIVTVGFLSGMTWGVLRFGHSVISNSVVKRVTDHLKEELSPIYECIGEMKEQISEVKKQSLPNGGSSMRDSINRIEKNSERTETKLDSAILDLAGHIGFHKGIGDDL